MQVVVRVMEGHHQEMRFEQFEKEETGLNKETAM